MAYTREQIEENLMKSSLWKNKLMNDNEVFLSIRNNDVALYHKGGKLFSYNGADYSTHIKYAAVIDKKNGDYMTENELATYNPMSFP